MRNTYTAQLEDLTSDLCALAGSAEDALRDASDALFGVNVHGAEKVIARSEYIETLGARCEDRAVSMLALQSPVAGDLRLVFSAVRISSDLSRMGGLAVHVGEAVRRQFPGAILNDALLPKFREMNTLCIDVAHRVQVALAEHDSASLAEIDAVVAEVDTLHDSLVGMVAPDGEQARANGGDDRADIVRAVNIALLCRFYQRFAAQAQDAAQRVAFLLGEPRL